MNKFTSLFLSLLIPLFFLSCSGGSSDADTPKVIIPSTDISLDGTYMSTLYSSLDGNLTKGILVPNKEANLSLINLKSSDLKLHISSKNGVTVVTPTSISIEKQSISFKAPLNVVDGNISLYENDTLLHSLEYKVYKAHRLYVTSFTPEVANVGELVTLNGQNFTTPMQLISTENDLNISLTSVGNQVSFTMPTSAKSSFFYLQTQLQNSNTIYIPVKRSVTVKVSNTLAMNHLDVAFTLGGVEYTVDNSFETTIPIENELQHIHATVELADGNFSHLYSAAVLKDTNTTLEIDANSTAVSWIMIGLGDIKDLNASRLRTLYDEISANSKVLEFASYVDELQKNDFSKWTDLSDTMLKEKFQDALLDVIQNRQANPAPRLADPLGDERSLVVIEQDPINGDIYVDDMRHGYFTKTKLNDGSVTLLNNTRLYLSLEARSKESGEIIDGYEHINDIMDMSKKTLIAPTSGGIASISNAQIINLGGEDANLEIIVGAYGKTTDKINISDALKARTVIDGIITPSLNLFLSMLMEKTIPSGQYGYKYLLEGMSSIYGSGFLIQLTTQVSNKDNSLYAIADTLVLTPLKSGVNSCFSIPTGNMCTNTLLGIVKLVGADPETAPHTILWMITDSIQNRVVKRSLSAIPIVGWIGGAAYFIYDNYAMVGIVSDIAAIGTTIKDMASNPKEINVDVEFKLKIEDVKPSCVGVTPADTQFALYVSGERFILEDSTSPTLLLNATEALSYDTLTDTKIYAQFDAQNAVSDGSSEHSVFVDYNGFSVMSDKVVKIIDQADTKIYFDSIQPDVSPTKINITLKGCGWIPLDDIKVYFNSENGDILGEIISSDIETIEVKVPQEAISGFVYVTAGSKRTQNIYLEIKEFGLFDSDISTINDNAEIVLYGTNLQDVTKVFFIDSSGANVEAILHTISISESSVIADIPQTLSVGEVKVYVVREDELESNTLSLKKLPNVVTATPDSQGFEGTISVSLSQDEGYEIIYYNQWDEAKTYSSSITIRANDIGVDGYILSTYARVIIDGVEYKSQLMQYQYIPASSDCPFKQDTTLHGYHTANESWLNTRDTNGDGYFDDYLRCSYYNDNNALSAEAPFFDNRLHGVFRLFYDSGRLASESPYTHGKEDGTFKRFYDSPQLRSQTIYVNGVLNGAYISHYTDGVTKEEGNYLNGRRNGIVRYYYETRLLRYLRTYENGALNGLQESYYDLESGTIQLELTGSKVDGKSDGVWTGYHENGETSSISVYTLGIRNGLFQSYFNTGTLKTQTPYVDDKMHGMAIENFSTGNPFKLTPYVNGIKNGVYKLYFSSNFLYKEITYVNNIQDGSYKEYWDGGIIRREIPYEDGLIEGVYRETRSDGNLWRTTTYSNDVKNGVLKYYYDSGAVNDETYYVNDLRHGSYKRYYESHKTRETGYYENNLREGQFKMFYESSGTMYSCTIYVNGSQTGSCMP